MKVARMMFTMLKRISNIPIMPRIQNQLTANGMNARRLSSRRRKLRQRNMNTTKLQTIPMKSKFSESTEASLLLMSLESKTKVPFPSAASLMSCRNSGSW